MYFPRVINVHQLTATRDKPLFRLFHWNLYESNKNFPSNLNFEWNDCWTTWIPDAMKLSITTLGNTVMQWCVKDVGVLLVTGSGIKNEVTRNRHSLTSLIASFMGPTWGPSGADRIQMGPMLAPWILLSGMFMVMCQLIQALSCVWGLSCQKRVSHAGKSNCIPHNTVGCNYLFLAGVPAPGTKVHIYAPGKCIIAGSGNGLLSANPLPKPM